MKKLIRIALCILGGTLTATGVLTAFSYQKTIALEHEIITSEVLSGRNYERRISMRALNPLVALIPYWVIYYSERPVDINYASPSLSVDLFGRVVDWSGKEVGFALEAKRYIEK